MNDPPFGKPNRSGEIPPGPDPNVSVQEGSNSGSYPPIWYLGLHLGSTSKCGAWTGLVS